MSEFGENFETRMVRMRVRCTGGLRIRCRTLGQEVRLPLTASRGPCISVKGDCRLRMHGPIVRSRTGFAAAQRSADLGVRISKQDSCNINVLVVRSVPYQYACAEQLLDAIS
jgi:hypothetical protein